MGVNKPAKHEPDGGPPRLPKLEQTDRQLTADAEIRRRALAGMDSLLQNRQDALQQAQAAQRAALSASKEKAGQLQSEINKIQAEQAAAAQQSRSSTRAGPGPGPA